MSESAGVLDAGVSPGALSQVEPDPIERRDEEGLQRMRAWIRRRRDRSVFHLRAARLRDRSRLFFLRVFSWVFPVVRCRRKGLVHVLGRAQVRSVMERPEDFSASASGARMRESIGAFFLGMDPVLGSPYQHEADAMRLALGIPDLTRERPPAADPSWERLRAAQQIARKHARACVKEALRRKGEIDVVNDLADVVPLRCVEDFFGIPEPAGGPQLLAWFRAASYYVFTAQAPEWKEAARDAGAAVTRHIEALVRSRQGGPSRDDVLGRFFLSSGALPVDTIVRCLSGVLSGTIIPTSWLFVKAIDRLLGRSQRERDRLHRYAVQGDAAAVRAHVLEAARFFPFPVYLLRDCVRGAAIGSTHVPAGTRVQLWMTTAATDRRALRRPLCFIPGRPEEELMLFGHAAHRCMGKDLAEAMLTEMTMALFAQRGLRRARGLRGLLDDRRDHGAIPHGPYPKRLVLEANGWSD